MTSITSLQSLLDDHSALTVTWDDKGEIVGCVQVSRCVSLSLRGTVLVGHGGPAIIVKPTGNLEILGGQVASAERDDGATATGIASGWRTACAIKVETGGQLRLTDVELLGDVSGGTPIAGEWHLPALWALTELPARARSTVTVRGFVPTRAEVVSDIHNVAVTVTSIGPGPVEFAIDIDARDVEPGVILDGWIRFLSDGAIRRLRLRARLAAPRQGIALAQPVWEAGAFKSPPLEQMSTIHREPVTSPGASKGAGVRGGASINPIFGGRKSVQGGSVPTNLESGQVLPPRVPSPPLVRPGQSSISPLFKGKPGISVNRDLTASGAVGASPPTGAEGMSVREPPSKDGQVPESPLDSAPPSCPPLVPAPDSNRAEPPSNASPPIPPAPRDTLSNVFRRPSPLKPPGQSS